MQKKSLDAVLQRLMTVFSVESDSELARKLGINRQTLGSWRSRQSIPYALCVNLSEVQGVSLDWLLKGEGEMFGNSTQQPRDPKSGCSPNEEAVIALYRSLSERDQREIQSAAEEKKRIREIEQRVEELTAALADGKRHA
jgi:transcriptional regulator with XRE-family HTH domain